MAVILRYLSEFVAFGAHCLTGVENIPKLLTLNDLEWRNGQTLAIFRFFKTAAAAILDFQIFEILTVGTLNMAKLRQCAKFCRNRSNRVRDMVIFRFSKMAATAILDFQIL